jgi:glucokinase
MIKEGRESSLAGTADVTAGMIHQAASAGDAAAREALEGTGYYLGVGVTNIVNVINPDAVLFSGGLAGAADILLPVIRREVSAHALEALTKNLTISVGAIPDDAGVIGAAGSAMKRLESDE